jgi:hypothetical protein
MIERPGLHIFTGIFFFHLPGFKTTKYSPNYSVFPIYSAPHNRTWKKKTIEIHICCIVTLLHLAVQRMHEFYDVQNISLNP